MCMGSASIRSKPCVFCLFQDGNLSGTTDQVIVFGAASKGIIQRDHQHNAVVYKSQYTANPFENVTEDELETYKRQIEGRGSGDNGEPWRALVAGKHCVCG